MKIEFSLHVFEKIELSDIMKILLVGASCSMRTDRQI